MGYRNLMISSACKLSVKNAQLLVEVYETGQTHSVPLEDINAIMLESQDISLNTYLLNALGENGICTFICDQKHLPSALVLPFESNYRQTKMLHLQLSVKKPFVKQLWQEIVSQKIENQGEVLRILARPEWEKIKNFANHVKSGDNENTEAVAAAQYFPALFGKGFTRRDGSGINAGLNYGYAILRGHICRSLVIHGLQTELGLFHSNQLNQFNLADDFIEIFRPVMDLYVAEHLELFELGLSPKGKQELFHVLSMDMKVEGAFHPVHYAIELMVQSYCRALEQGVAKLCLCSVCPLKLHRYE